MRGLLAGTLQQPRKSEFSLAGKCFDSSLGATVRQAREVLNYGHDVDAMFSCSVSYGKSKG